MAERQTDILGVDDGPVFCRACRLDVTAEPAQRGVRTCPRCGRGVRVDGSNSAPRPRAECRCPHCGFDVGGIPGSTSTVRCPECGRHVDLMHGPMLEPWPGDRAAVLRTLSYVPIGVGCYLAVIGVVVAINFGAPPAWMVWAALAFCVILSVGEAGVQARKIVWASVPARERWGEAVRVGAVGVGLTAAAWLPVILLTAVALYLL